MKIIDRNIIYAYLSKHYTPQRMVLAGVGVDHDRLVEAAEKYFVDEQPIWQSDSSLVSKKYNTPIDKSIAQYTGGIIQVNTKKKGNNRL